MIWLNSQGWSWMELVSRFIPLAKLYGMACERPKKRAHRWPHRAFERR